MVACWLSTIALIDDKKVKDIQGYIARARLGSRRGKSIPTFLMLRGASRYLVPILSEIESRVYPPSRYYPLEQLQKLWTADRPAATAGVRLIHLGPSHMTGQGETYSAEVLTQITSASRTFVTRQTWHDEQRESLFIHSANISLVLIANSRLTFTANTMFAAT